MLLRFCCCLVLLLAVEGAPGPTAGLSPLLVGGTLPSVPQGRLVKRAIGQAPPQHDSDEEEEEEEEEENHSGVAGHPPTDHHGSPSINMIGHPPTSELDEDDDFATDYDFVLDLDEQADFERLLRMLSRSGPAKPLHEEVAGPSSTFLDRHDELEHPSPTPHSSHAAPLLPRGSKYSPQRVDPHDDGSHFDDLEKQKKEAEQRRLEELYFNQIEGNRPGSSVEENEPKHGALRHSAGSITSPSITISLAAFLMLFCFH